MRALRSRIRRLTSLAGLWLLAAPCAGQDAEEAAAPRYRFEPTEARHEGPQEPPGRLSFETAEGLRVHELPPGADVWRDESANGYLIVRFMDRRFSAFATSGLDYIDLDSGRRVPVLRGLVHEVPDLPADLLAGVRRVPREGRPLGDRKLPGEAYDAAVFELVAVFFDPPARRWHLVPLRTAPWLPDDNQPWPPGEPPPTLVYVRDGALFVATDFSGAAFERIELGELVPD